MKAQTDSYADVCPNPTPCLCAAGIFTAPRRGVYYFSFSGHNESTRNMALSLMKNGVQVVTVVNHWSTGNTRWETATNGMIVQLEAGDTVYMELHATAWMNENSVVDHSTFIGHLLFPL